MKGCFDVLPRTTKTVQTFDDESDTNQCLLNELIFVLPLLLTAARHDASTEKQDFKVPPRYFDANRGQASKPVWS